MEYSERLLTALINAAEFTKKQKEIVSAYVVNIDPETGNASIKIDKSIATLTKAEQAGLKDLKEGDVVKVYIADILSDTEPTPGKKGKNKRTKFFSRNNR